MLDFIDDSTEASLQYVIYYSVFVQYAFSWGNYDGLSQLQNLTFLIGCQWIKWLKYWSLIGGDNSQVIPYINNPHHNTQKNRERGLSK